MAVFILLFTLASVVPAVMVLLAIARRLQRRQMRGEPRRRLWIFAAGMILVAAYQAAVSLDLLIQSFRGLVDLDLRHGVALLLAWVCLWLRVGMRHFRRERSRRGY